MSLVFLVSCLDRWLRKSKINLDPNTDLIVITGGDSKNGLGHCMALDFLALRGFSVAILGLNLEWKISDPEKIKFIQCDVSVPAQVRAARTQIQNLFPTKSATVLINNAGLAHNKTILELDEQTIRNVVEVNLLGPFWTVQTFGPDMLRNGKGYIVNISSVLGTLGVKQLSAYCASKAGLVGFHDSITHELSNPYNYYPSKKGDANIATLLVTPGHFSTTMFDGLSTPSDFVGPILLPQQVSRTIVDAVISGETGTLTMPLFTGYTWLLKAVPGCISEFVRSFSGLDKEMDAFRGSKKEYVRM